MAERVVQPIAAPAPAAALAPMSASNPTPIIIIDGVNLGRLSPDSMNVRINALGGPNAIEDIEVIKGPSAAMLYGSDAQSGIIIIRTKVGAAKA